MLDHAVIVNGPERVVAVAVVLRPDEQPYIRACAEGVWTDHLLALPTFCLVVSQSTSEIGVSVSFRPTNSLAASAPVNGASAT
jgi:hypothetical protein